MREYPLFIPHGPDRLASVIAVPDGEPGGLVLLLTGGSAARSHRFGVWTRAARRLAEEHGLASIRMDYRGTGDSTGTLRQWRMSEKPVDQCMAVLRFAEQAVGVDRVAVTGNCMGSRLALEVAAQTPECIGAMCIRSPILGPSNVGKLMEKAGRTRLGDIARSSTAVRTAVRNLAGRKKRSSVEVRGSVGRILSHGHLLFLYSQDDFTFNEQVRRELDQMAARLPADQRARYELRVMSSGNLKGFESLDVQDRVIDAVSTWMGRRFEDASREGDAAGPSRVHRAGP